MIGNNRKINKKSFGFTLMEIVVVMGMFSIFFLIVTDVFMMVLKAQRQTSFRQQDLSELRYVVEVMARQIRNSEIDYSAFINYPDKITFPTSELHLIDDKGIKYSFNLSSQVIEETVNGQVTPLNDPINIQVNRLSFYIDPPYNPFSSERCNNSLSPTGCFGGLPICTVNDNSGMTGYCNCVNASNTGGDSTKCANGNCVEVKTGSYLCMPLDRQPRVTILVGFMSKSNKTSEMKTIYLQTTASSRIYKR